MPTSQEQASSMSYAEARRSGLVARIRDRIPQVMGLPESLAEYPTGMTPGQVWRKMKDLTPLGIRFPAQPSVTPAFVHLREAGIIRFTGEMRKDPGTDGVACVYVLGDGIPLGTSNGVIKVSKPTGGALLRGVEWLMKAAIAYERSLPEDIPREAQRVLSQLDSECIKTRKKQEERYRDPALRNLSPERRRAAGALPDRSES